MALRLDALFKWEDFQKEKQFEVYKVKSYHDSEKYEKQIKE